MSEKQKVEFFRDRILSIFDNVVWIAFVYLLSILIPIVGGLLLKIEIQVLLLIALLICQILGFVLLYSIRRKLSGNDKKNNHLVKNKDTGDLYLIDRFGLPHTINDKETSLYFMEIFGFSSDEIPSVSPESIKPLGAEITAIRRWKAPRTKEDEMSSEARGSFWVSHKYARNEGNTKIISVDVRNDNDQVVQIDSVKLVFMDSAPPLSISDISPKNKPTAVGLLQCKMLFKAETPSKALSPEEANRLDLFLKGDFSESEMTKLVGTRFGYLEVSGTFRDTHISFHIDV